MTRADWMAAIHAMLDEHPRPRNEGESDAIVEALLAVAATAYSAQTKAGSHCVEELANAAYYALQDKAEEIQTRN